MEQQFIVIKNFNELQHYKNRNPLWIKLYTKLLRSDKFFYLIEEERWIYVGLLLLAGLKDNKVLYDLNFIKANICHWETTNEKLDRIIRKLAEIDMLDIKLLSQCYQVDSGKKRREEKRREENIYTSIDFCKNPPENDIKELMDKFSVSRKCVLDRCDDVVGYCEAGGKKYSNYKAALRNFLKSHILRHPECVIEKKELPRVEVDTRTEEEKAKDRARRDAILAEAHKMIKKL